MGNIQSEDGQDRPNRPAPEHSQAQESTTSPDDQTNQDYHEESNDREAEEQNNPPQAWLDHKHVQEFDGSQYQNLDTSGAPQPNPYYDPSYNDAQSQTHDQSTSEIPDFWNMPEEDVQFSAEFLTIIQLEQTIKEFITRINTDREHEGELRNRLNWGPGPRPIPAGRGRGRGQAPGWDTEASADEHTRLVAQIMDYTRRVRTIARRYDSLEQQESAGILWQLAFDPVWIPQPRSRPVYVPNLGSYLYDGDSDGDEDIVVGDSTEGQWRKPTYLHLLTSR